MSLSICFCLRWAKRPACDIDQESGGGHDTDSGPDEEGEQARGAPFLSRTSSRWRAAVPPVVAPSAARRSGD